MTWFKVDDKLPDHRKTRAVRKSHPTKRRDAGPFGIYVLAGAWSTDGYVPLEWLEDQDDDAFEYAERLVSAGMWHPVERDGEPGYVFHDWAVYNPANGENDPSVAGTFGNHIRWHVQRKIVDFDCRHCPSEPSAEQDSNRGDDRPDIGAMSHPDIGVVGGESLPSRPDPTRPVPNPTLLVDTSTDRFEEFWDTYGKKKDRKTAEQKWRLALKKPGVTADMLIAAAAAYVKQERANEGGRYIMGPAKWLLGERWADQDDSTLPVVSRIPQAVELEAAPSGMTDQEWYEWDQAQRAKRVAQ